MVIKLVISLHTYWPCMRSIVSVIKGKVRGLTEMSNKSRSQLITSLVSVHKSHGVPSPEHSYVVYIGCTLPTINALLFPERLHWLPYKWDHRLVLLDHSEGWEVLFPCFGLLCIIAYTSAVPTCRASVVWMFSELRHTYSACMCMYIEHVYWALHLCRGSLPVWDSKHVAADLLVLSCIINIPWKSGPLERNVLSFSFND